MNWYYAQEGKQVGPVSDEEFAQLATRGVIRPETLVWHEGMANWQPYAQAAAGAAAPAPAPAGPAATAGGAAAVPAAASVAQAAQPGHVACAECGRLFPRDEAINYGTVWVCSTCKPTFVQKLREGATLGAPTLRFAGFWIRFAARIVDGLIAMILIGLPTMLVVVFGVRSSAQNPGAGAFALQGFAQLAGLAFSVAYETFFVGKFGATPGKMAIGVRVVMADGSKVTYMRAFGRAWAVQLSSFICSIGFIIAAWDKEKRALHDHICNTRVIYK